MEILSRLVSKQVSDLLFLSNLCTPHSVHFGFKLKVSVSLKGCGFLILVLIKLHPFVCLFLNISLHLKDFITNEMAFIQAWQ